MASDVTRPGDWGRDIYQTERRIEAVSSATWDRAVTLDSPGFVDCADVAFRWPLSWAGVVVYRVLLRIGTTLHLYTQSLFPPAGPNVIQLGQELSGLLVRIRGIPHDGLIVETLLPVAAAAAGVATCHAKNWARSPSDMSIGQVNVDIPQPLVVSGSVAIAPQPVEVFGLVEVAEPVTVQGTVAIAPQPVEVFGTVAIAPQPVEVNDAAAARFADVIRQDAAVYNEVTFPFGASALIEGHHVWNESNNPGYFFTAANGAIPGVAVPSWLCPVLVPARTSISIEYPPIKITNGFAWGASTNSVLWQNPQLPASPKFLVTTFWRAVP